jgi:siroheme synthase-like protein
MLPIVLDLQGKTAVVVGAGQVGSRRAAQLVAEGARVRVIAKEILAPLPDRVEEVLVRPYRRGDLVGAMIAVAAVGDAAVNNSIRAEAEETSTLLNVVDDPDRSTVYFPAVRREGPVTVAVSTEGASPALALYLRDQLAEHLPADLASVADALREERRLLHARGMSTESIDWGDRIAELLGSPPCRSVPC